VFFAQAFAVLLGILVGYGFLLSGARDIARQRDDLPAMERTLAGVLAGQIVLVGVGTVATLIALVGVEEFRSDRGSSPSPGSWACRRASTPAWFLLGLEQIRAVAFNEVVVRSLSAVAIVLFVRDPGDGLLVLWIWSIANAFVTLGLLRLVLRTATIRRASLAEGWRVLRSGLGPLRRDRPAPCSPRAAPSSPSDSW
jgi:PST family polysaccharide transporter